MSNRFNKKASESRYLNFTDDVYYATLYGALLNNNKGFDRVEIRIVDKILTKLEAIGTQTGEGVKTDYKLREDGGVVELTDVEYKLTKECLDSLKWLGSYARNAIKLLDWFDNAPTSDPRNEAPPAHESDNVPQTAER